MDHQVLWHDKQQAYQCISYALILSVLYYFIYFISLYLFISINSYLSKCFILFYFIVITAVRKHRSNNVINFLYHIETFKLNTNRVAMQNRR